MITLKDLIVSVKEKNLSKDQLEAYRDQLSGLYAEMNMEMADLEKEEALFLENWHTIYAPDGSEKERSVAQRKIDWKATPSGQRLIVLKRYCLATKELLNSLKSRLYSIY